ncbi:MAG: ABC transporter permease [Verrucomicrobia bacterium]|nr:ABC transporter permease [Verrucomicrobiota bacterium]
MTRSRANPLLLALNNASLVLFLAVLAVFGVLSPRFLTVPNLTNVLVQSASTAIVAVGMTFVLLTAGVDLSVGAIMFVAAAVAGKMVLGGAPLWLALVIILLIGLAFGAINAFFITRLRIIAFIVTLATLYLGRGFALWFTETRAMNLPPSFLAIGTERWLGVPLPILLLAAVVALAHVVLTRTPFGRQLYALGQDVEAARKAGIKTGRRLAAVYVISGFCAALGGILALAQLGAVSPTFGTNKEFAAIAAAVLGGTSLFGGRGSVFPGTVLGALLIQSVENGLVILDADPYLYPLITSGIIFIAVLTDSVRSALLAKLGRRRIRVEEMG